MQALSNYHPSHATQAAQYKNKRYVLFQKGSCKMEHLISGFVNTLDTTTVKTLLQCSLNPPFQSLPIHFDCVSRFNNVPFKSSMFIYIENTKYVFKIGKMYIFRY